MHPCLFPDNAERTFEVSLYVLYALWFPYSLVCQGFSWILWCCCIQGWERRVQYNLNNCFVDSTFCLSTWFLPLVPFLPSIPACYKLGATSLFWQKSGTYSCWQLLLCRYWAEIIHIIAIIFYLPESHQCPNPVVLPASVSQCHHEWFSFMIIPSIIYNLPEHLISIRDYTKSFISINSFNFCSFLWLYMILIGLWQSGVCLIHLLSWKLI